MPLPVAHGLLGASIVAALYPDSRRTRYALHLLGGFLAANVADFDLVLVFAFHSEAWHRDFSHSVGFALLVSLPCVLLFGRQRVREAIAFCLAFASHGILDFATTKAGIGVELLWPISQERLSLGFWGLSEVPSKLGRSELIEALVVEFAIFTPLLLALLLFRNVTGTRITRSEDAT